MPNRTNTKSFDPTKFSHNNPYTYTASEQCAILQKFKAKQPVYIWQSGCKPPYWGVLDPDQEIQFNFLENIYSTTIPTQTLPAFENIPPRKIPADIPVFPPTHVCHNRIVYDSDSREYYDKQNDLFLSEDDIKFYGLREYIHITTPLPSPLPENYWDALPL